VSEILKKLSGAENPDEILQLQVLNEKHTPNGIYRSWESHEKIPPCSLRNLLTRFLDITAAPSRQLLLFLASCCEDEKEKASLNKLATESALYEDWKHSKLPHLLEVFEEFPSCKPPASLLISQLTPLQPRFYSISSSQKKFLNLNEIHLTVAVANYKNEGNVTYISVIQSYVVSLLRWEISFWRLLNLSF
jgi:nitric-oxide synthase